MQATKITTPQGAFIIICDRANEEAFACDIKHISSTEAQPFIVVNHNTEGKAIGGSTATKSISDALIARSSKAGLPIAQIEI